ncbi:MAG: hypothetical protein B9S34_12880 [Opitutia bacterium Tous-C1TDCM]|nr:MAG: hypothetical protein B9S34_12880 [Opitutae bacterium Tous-C1TDCM]
MNPWVQGALIGFSIAAPVGPVGLLCIRRAMTQGRLSGLVSGLGAATADTVYGLLAALGLTAVTQVLLDQRHWLQGIGGVFLLGMGIATFKAEVATAAANDSGTRPGLGGAFWSTLLLTLTSPMTVLAFAGVFAGLGLGQAATMGVRPALLLVGGVFCGSALWWLLLSTFAASVGRKFERRHFVWLNRCSGSLLAGFGLWQLAALLR